jgi:glucose-1-phosphate adenylyltransferase
MGIYVFHRDALVELLRGDGDDFGRHLLPTAAKKIPTYGYLYNDYWVDIGTIQSFYEANMTFLRGERCLDVYDEANPIYTHPQHVPSPFVRGTYIERSVIGQGAIVEAKTIIRSVVGLRAVIHPDCVIEESVIMGNHTYRPHLQESLPLPKEFSIGRGSHIRRAIIDEQTKIGQGVKLLNLEGRETFDGRGIYIRDGIIIVPTGSEIPDGFTL